MIGDYRGLEGFSLFGEGACEFCADISRGAEGLVAVLMGIWVGVLGGDVCGCFG